MKKYSLRLVAVIFHTKLFHITGAILLLITIIIPSCKKETDKKITANTGYIPQVPPPPPPPPATSVSLVWVWTNEYVAYPADSSMLYGYAGLNNQNASYIWKKIAGPASYNIHNPNSLVTKVDKLEIGEYEFEITATDVYGRKGSATLNVYVIKPGQNETIFKNLVWMCPFGCSAYIQNIYSFIPQNKPILVFVRPANSSTWLPALPPAFEYSIDGNNFSLFTDDATGSVDVKIQY